ncbi:hypothetical protein M2320_003898 [Rhodoblastus acidophilus]|nr:hypothetical protein [Rhodoblastus acidophilus]
MSPAGIMPGDHAANIRMTLTSNQRRGSPRRLSVLEHAQMSARSAPPAGRYKILEPDFLPFTAHLKANGISLRTGQRLVKAGKLKVTKIGRLSYIQRADWQKFRRSLNATLVTDPVDDALATLSSLKV